jgi:hypothetical protein
MKKNLYLAFFFLLVVAAGCTKKSEDLDEKGQTVIKFAEAPENKLFFTPFSSIQPITLFNVRRDVHNQGALGVSAKIKLRENMTLLAEYNHDNNANYEMLPDSLYTLSDPGARIPEGFLVTFAPSEFAKDFVIRLNGAKWDLSKKYALPLSISDAGTDNIISGDKQDIIALISLKNKWDGIYSLKGETLRAGDPARTGRFQPIEMELATSGANSVTFGTLQVWADGSGVAIGNPTFAINADNSITISSSGGAINSSAAGTSYQSRYDPATKTFYAQFTWGAGLASRLATDTLVYLRPR